MLTLTLEHWTFDGLKRPLLTGISQLLDAQSFVNQRTHEEDPGEGLSGAGIKSLSAIRAPDCAEGDKDDVQSPKSQKPVLHKAGLPQSSINGEPLLQRRQNGKDASASPRSPKKSKQPVVPNRVQKARRELPKRSIKSESNDPQNDHRPSLQADIANTLPSSSPYAKAHIVGTTSAKLSYLLDQILIHYRDEKILVFYQGENIAYYIAQALELLGEH